MARNSESLFWSEFLLSDWLSEVVLNFGSHLSVTFTLTETYQNCAEGQSQLVWYAFGIKQAFNVEKQLHRFFYSISISQQKTAL